MKYLTVLHLIWFLRIKRHFSDIRSTFLLTFHFIFCICMFHLFWEITYDLIWFYRLLKQPIELTEIIKSLNRLLTASNFNLNRLFAYLVFTGGWGTFIVRFHTLTPSSKQKMLWKQSYDGFQTCKAATLSVPGTREILTLPWNFSVFGL